MEEITLKFEINIPNGMHISMLMAHTTILSQEELDEWQAQSEKNKIKGEIITKILTNKIRIELAGTSTDHGLRGSINFTLSGKKVFEEDQKFVVNEFGRISWIKESVKLPI